MDQVDNEDLYAALKPDGTPQQLQTRAERIAMAFLKSQLIEEELKKTGPLDPLRVLLIHDRAMIVHDINDLAIVKCVERQEKRKVAGKIRKSRGPHSLITRMKTAATLRAKKNTPSTLPADVFTKLRNLDVPEPPPPEELADLENKKGLENFLTALKAKKDEPEKPS